MVIDGDAEKASYGWICEMLFEGNLSLVSMTMVGLMGEGRNHVSSQIPASCSALPNS